MNDKHLIGLDEIAEALVPADPAGTYDLAEFASGVAARIEVREDAPPYDSGQGELSEGELGPGRSQESDWVQEGSSGGSLLAIGTDRVEPAAESTAGNPPRRIGSHEWAPRWLRRASAIAPAGAMKVVTAKGAKGASSSLLAGPLMALAAIVVVGAWLTASALRLSDKRQEKEVAGRSLWTSRLSAPAASTLLVLLLIAFSGSVGSHALLLAGAGVILLVGTLALLRVHMGTGPSSPDELSTTLASFYGQVGFSMWIAGGNARVGLESLAGIGILLCGALWLGRHVEVEDANRLPVARARRGVFLVGLVLLTGLALYRYPLARTEDGIVSWVERFHAGPDDPLEWEDLQLLIQALPPQRRGDLDLEFLADLLPSEPEGLHPAVLEAVSANDVVDHKLLEADLSSALRKFRRTDRGLRLFVSGATASAIRFLQAEGEWTDIQKAGLADAIDQQWPAVDRIGALEDLEQLLHVADVAGVEGIAEERFAELAEFLERRIVRCRPLVDPVAVAGFDIRDLPGHAIPFWPVGRAHLDSTVAGVRLMGRLHSVDPKRYAALDIDVSGIARYLDKEARGFVLMRDMTYGPRAAGALRILRGFDPEGAADHVARPLRMAFVLCSLLAVGLALAGAARAQRRESVFSGPLPLN